MTTQHIPTGIEALVCEDIARRQALGIQKYGQTVAENRLELRAWMQHAYEEMLDGAVYLRRAMEETDALRKDAERFRWCLERNPSVIAGIAYGVKEACDHADPVAALDAAMAATANKEPR